MRFFDYLESRYLKSHLDRIQSTRHIDGVESEAIDSVIKKYRKMLKFFYEIKVIITYFLSVLRIIKWVLPKQQLIDNHDHARAIRIKNEKIEAQKKAQLEKQASYQENISAN